MPAPRKFSSLIPGHVRPSRVPGLVAIRDGTDTKLRSPSGELAELNPSAFLVWSFCDGLASVSNIEQQLSAGSPEMEAQIEIDVRNVLTGLRDLGAIDLTGARRSNPLVRIAFSNIDPHFSNHNNYFTVMLSDRFDLLIVDPATEPTDLLFFSDAPSLSFDHREIDDTETLKIFFGGPSVQPDPALCDFAFSLCPSELAETGDQFPLPGWALLIDWYDSGNMPHKLSFRRLLQPTSSVEKHDYFCATTLDQALHQGEDLIDQLQTAISPLVQLRPYSPSCEDHFKAMSKCKFVLVHGDRADPIAAETELLYALYSYTVPIYFGSAPLPEAFNSEAFIDCNNFASVAETVRFIEAINKDPDKYNEFLNKPPLHENLARRYAPETVGDEFYKTVFDPQETTIEDVNPPRPKHRKRKLTIGMATYDDYDGVYFSVQAIRMFHPEVTDDTDILVVDNNPTGACASALERLESWVDGFTRIAYDEYKGTSVRDLIFREAKSDYVLCIDSHVLIQQGGIKSLIEYFDDHPGSPDLIQGPLISDDLKGIATHMDAEWRSGMLGVWARDERAENIHGKPFEVPMHGLGVFACRRDAWLGFNPRFLGFGGEEGYIHEKFRQAGHRTLCLPALRWLHRFNRPFGLPYPGIWEDRIRNYLIGFDELGIDTSGVTQHFRRHIGPQVTDAAVIKVKRELTSPFHYFDAIYCINLDSDIDRWNAIYARFEKLGIAHRIRRFSAVETTASHHVGCALSHRRIIARAQKQGLNNVLVFEDDAIFLDEIAEYLNDSVRELSEQDWNIFYLGGHRWGKQFPKINGCACLEKPEILTCTHAIAYNKTIYKKILSDIPDEAEAVVKWREKHRAIDQYLIKLEKRFLASPVVASQPSILAQELLEHQDRFS